LTKEVITLNPILIYGPEGDIVSTGPQELQEAAATPLLPGGTGWLPGVGDAATYDYTGGGRWVDTQTDGGPGGLFTSSRTQARRLCKGLFFLPNPLFQGAVELVVAFLGGDEFSYAEHPDKAVRTCVEQFWSANNLGELFISRWLPEFLLTGESATVFPTGADDPGPNLPARVALLDVDQVTVASDSRRGATASDMATSVSISDNFGNITTWNTGEFVWTANNAMFNDVRGWPVVLGAAHAAIAYIAMANARLNIHEVQQRVIAVYTAALNPAGVGRDGMPDAGQSTWKAKTGAFRRLPARGGVIPLVTSPGYKDDKGNVYQGYTEKLEFPQPASGASDSATDAKTFLRLVGLCMGGLPEHWLGEGGHATRTTASEMNKPAMTLAKKRQGVARSWLDRLIRTELKRRNGPDKLYTVVTYVGQGATRKKRTRKVPADLIEIGWSFPMIDEKALADLITRAELASEKNWAAPETLSASLGFDAGAEEEKLAARGLVFGQPTATVTTPSGGSDATGTQTDATA